ncbi:MAG: glycosyltransferase family 2 protein [Roseimicrobium sp.]
MPERVAVIIPCYNHARYVGEAIESALRQTRKPDRVIVIDDGSRDDSVEVLNTFRSQGVEVSARENQGAHATINELVQKAAKDCDFISILNSDDRYLPDRIQRCLERARQCAGKAVFATRLQVIDGAGAAMPGDAPRARWFHGALALGQHEGVEIPEWLGQANFIATTSNIFGRSAYMAANPMQDYRFIHDYFFLSTAALENNIEFLPEVLMEYRVHGSNTIATRPEPLIREMIKLQVDFYRHHARTLHTQPDFRKRFYQYARGTWSSISSLHAGMVQVALAQLAAKADEKDVAAVLGSLAGPELLDFPNKVLAASYDGKNGLTPSALLSKRVEDLKDKLSQEKVDNSALDMLCRFRHRMLRSHWVRLGLLLGFCHPLVSNRGKRPHEKMLWLRDTCQGHWWLRIGEFLGSSTCYDLRRGTV